MNDCYIESHQAVVRTIVNGKENIEIIDRIEIKNSKLPVKGCKGEMGDDDVLRCKGKCKQGTCHKITDEQGGIIVEWCECDKPPPA